MSEGSGDDPAAPDMKVALFSFAVTLLSVLVVLASTNIVPVHLESFTSPYSPEIEQILVEPEVNLSRGEYERLIHLFLFDKNSLWYQEQMEVSSGFSKARAREEWTRRSSLLAPLVMLVWGVLFYFFYKRWPSRYALLVLSFPILFTVAGAMTVIELLLIALAVLVVRFWFEYTADTNTPLN